MTGLPIFLFQENSRHQDYSKGCVDGTGTTHKRVCTVQLATGTDPHPGNRCCQMLQMLNQYVSYKA